MEFYDYETRLSRPVKVKISELQTGDRLNHMIFADQLTPGMIDRLTRTADRIRMLAKSKESHRFLNDLLRHKRGMLYFTQPSTRTFLSFMAACQILGITCSEVRDPAVSSESKGESPFDSMRMFSSYFDVVIMRSKTPQFAECCAYMMNDLNATHRRHVPIVNAGAGADEHPTQALLDIYSIQRAMAFFDERDSSQRTLFMELRRLYPDLRKGIAGKKFGFCGDIRRGRTIRSLVHLLSQYEGVSMYFVSPDHPKLALPAELREWLLARRVDVREFSSFDELAGNAPVIETIDCLYMTRIQREHNSPEDEAAFKAIDMSLYRLTPELVARMKSYAPILHPFPRDEGFGEIPISIDADPRAYYFRQARNGMWARAALLAHLFDIEQDIADYYSDYTRDVRDYNLGAV